MKPTHVYIVDDSLTIRAMMQSIVEQDEAFEVCGLAADAEQALDEIDTISPEILLLDLALPTLDGLSFMDRIQKHIRDPWHALKVIVVSGSAKHDSQVCTDAFDRGATACFDKSCVSTAAEEFMTLLHEVRAGAFNPDNHLSAAVTLPSWVETLEGVFDDEGEQEDEEDDGIVEGQYRESASDRDRSGTITFI